MSELNDNPFGRMIQAEMESGTSPHREQVHRLADGVRRVIEELVSSYTPIEELARVADVVEELATGLEAQPRLRGYDSFAESANAGTPYSFFDHSPIIGSANPLAPPAHLRIEDERVVGTVTFGSAYEGPPGHAHGGYVAAVFDELLGMTQSLAGQSGMTGTLVVRYRRPTPLHQRLDLEAEVVKVEGRKVFVAGRCFHEGGLTAECEGIFISIGGDRFAQLMASRRQGQGTGDD